MASDDSACSTSARREDLEAAYLEAWEEWHRNEAEVWEVTVGDGLSDDPPT